MIKVTLEFVVLLFFVSICLIIALALVLKSLFPVILLGTIVYLLYRHNTKGKDKCPECEVRDKVNHL